MNFMLHVGGQVDLKNAFEEAWTLLKRGCIGEDDQKALEDKAREILRRVTDTPGTCRTSARR